MKYLVHNIFYIIFWIEKSMYINIRLCRKHPSSEFAGLHEILPSLVGRWKFVYFEYIWQFIQQGFVAVSHTNTWYIGPCYIVSENAFFCEIRSEPMLFGLKDIIF